MRKMTEAEAWVILAEAYEQDKVEGIGTSFLCIAVKYGNLGFDDDMRVAMVNRIVNALDPENDGVAYLEDIPDDEQFGGRVLACLVFAAQAEDGYAD